VSRTLDPPIKSEDDNTFHEAPPKICYNQSMNFFLQSFLVAISINLFMFIPAFILKTDKITDISYAVTFAVVALAGYAQSTQTVFHKIILALVLMWSARLGTFLFIRINKMGKDVRFDGIRENFLKFLQFWLLQGATVFVVMLAALYGFSKDFSNVKLQLLTGAAVFITGLMFEATADAQKFKFNNNPKNKGQWIDVGVWRASRHPNYLGEMMVWTGMYLVAVGALSKSERIITLLSPVYIICLLLFVSGVPMLEKSAMLKWGKDKNYLKYKNQVPSVLPSLGSLKRMVSK
jgi:steroid 5-alpha reductase family enzyme